ncbi:hypothetical protein NP233_g10505 [Leucocoprinus birnbaumii]|uniref:2'-phosphotransferase n=1 Tax=Leucocoprinus birnbaumii TaxID=56174 RepID=A0AAD5VLY4_9AGAR|nr:hypothetical protein NP233_g10505 [Leucocoprinus birnbaumii]
MNPVKLIRKPPTAVYSNVSKTLNAYPKTIRDPSQRYRLRPLGWEERPIRIANTVTWLLEHAKKQGLTARGDGYVRVHDLLQHPELNDCDFPTLETAINRYRMHQLKLSYAPQNSLHGAYNESQVCCWWIGLQRNRKYEHHAGRRVVNYKEATDLIYRIPSQEWPDIRDRGICRGDKSQITFHNDIMIPFHYTGENTFIRLSTRKLRKSKVPLYSTRTVNRRLGNRVEETFSTPEPTVSPSIFEAAMRVAVERFPLILRATPPPPKSRKGRKLELQNQKEIVKPRVKQSGIDALRRYGFSHVLEKSRLEASLKDEDGASSAELVEKVEEIEALKERKHALEKIPNTQDLPNQSTKDPPPHHPAP